MRLVWGAVNARPPSQTVQAGAIPVRLERRLEDDDTDSSGRRSEIAAPALRRACTRLSGDRLQGAGRLVLGRAEAGSRISLIGATRRMNRDRRSGSSTSRTGQGPPAILEVHTGLGLQRPGPRPLRTSDVSGTARLRLQGRARRGAGRQVRAQPVHRHVRLGVRSGLEARDVNQCSVPGAARSVTASGPRTTTRCRAIRTIRARQATASAIASRSKAQG